MKKDRAMTSGSLENTALVLKSLEENGEFNAFTKGPSMQPMLRQGRDIVIIKKAVGELQKGDVPLYKRPNYDYLVLHRILKVRENDYIIRGDNTYKLEYVPKEYVVGVLSGFYHKGKYYDCSKSKAYKAYIFYNRLNYPLRFLWKIKIIPRLSLLKRKLFKK